MTIREALTWGLLRTEPIGEGKGDRVVTLDGTYTLWHDSRRPQPYRWARAEISSQPEQAACTEGIARHGGAATLEGALRATVLLRSSRCR